MVFCHFGITAFELIFVFVIAFKQIEIDHRFRGCLWQLEVTEGYCWKYHFFMFFIALLMLLLSSSASAQEVTIVDDGFICIDATTKAEQKYQIQKYLLTSISTVETGKWNKSAQQKMAWPWTINVRGKGHYYKTKEAAVKAAQNLRKKGINNFDVGCMQINMRFHGKEFASLEDAFDPQKNVEYAAKFLKKLYDRRQDWMQAATDYHSKRPSKAKIYKKKLLASIETVKKGHQTYTTLYASNLFEDQNTEKKQRSWLSRWLWGDDEDEKSQDVKLSLRN